MEWVWFFIYHLIVSMIMGIVGYNVGQHFARWQAREEARRNLFMAYFHHDTFSRRPGLQANFGKWWEEYADGLITEGELQHRMRHSEEWPMPLYDPEEHKH